MSIGWPDLPGALLLVVAGLLIVAGVIGLVVWDARRRGEPHVLLRVTAAIARMWLALTGLTLVIGAWRWFSGGDTWIARLPIAMEWPAPTCTGETGPFTEPTVVCASVNNADASIAALSFGTRATLALGELLGLVVVAMPAVVVVIICAYAVRGAPFAKPAARWLFIAALVILIAGLGAAILTDVGQSLAAMESLPASGEGPVTAQPTYRIDVPPWPIGIAFALGALGVIFRHGSRLQRDTEGLV
ncbi:hypothetical protein GCM10009775_09530 [Microbacterium aoyamense]|uniref:DUF2975 domain-containing protein n=1 Tax=Microbacterium aoyamense TaxID=344166 RepID=A0ABN2PEY2_9MICO|nr:hypothetical protein [Microbacterium aoyamense]